jgi:hypothetical protein
MAGLVIGVLGLVSAVAIPSVLVIQALIHSVNVVLPVLALVLNLAALTVSIRGRRSRLFGVAVAGIIVSLVGAGVEILFLIYVLLEVFIVGAPPSPSGAHFTVVNIDRACYLEMGECVVVADIKNAGTGTGRAAVAVEVADSSIVLPKVLATQTCSSERTGPEQTTRVRCIVSSSDLSAFLHGSGASPQPRARIIENKD